MNGEARARLVESICETYTLEQLDRRVKGALEKHREYFAIGRDLPSIVDKLIEELERTPDKLFTFLLNIREGSSTGLRSAINTYLGITENPPKVDETPRRKESQYETRVLSQQESRELVTRLKACSTMKTQRLREQVVAQLPLEISGLIQVSNATLPDVTSIVSTCNEYVGGIAKLVEALRFFENSSNGMRAVDEFLETLWV
jgi:hypothetical protein